MDLNERIGIVKELIANCEEIDHRLSPRSWSILVLLIFSSSAGRK